MTGLGWWLQIFPPACKPVSCNQQDFQTHRGTQVLLLPIHPKAVNQGWTTILCSQHRLTDLLPATHDILRAIQSGQGCPYHFSSHSTSSSECTDAVPRTRTSFQCPSGIDVILFSVADSSFRCCMHDSVTNVNDQVCQHVPHRAMQIHNLRIHMTQ